MSDQGWIKLHRKIASGFFWNEKPFDRARAWIDLILMANHDNNKFLLGNQVIEIERGSLITSEHKLMKRWGWSKSKVRAFLFLLVNEQMLIKKTDQKKTTLTIVNYSVYQDKETTKEPVKDHKKTDEKPVPDPNKNDKNVKNDKKVLKDIYADHVRLTKDEHKKLIEKLGEQKAQEMIERLNTYGHTKAKAFKQYTSHYHVILNWVSRDKKGDQANGYGGRNNGYSKPSKAGYRPSEVDWENEPDTLC